uniref:Ig-like domain-containing protein n=1 Tax=Varanus komodoensis TaxID=61221 RepID=A0A8D2J5N8_VARKO
MGNPAGPELCLHPCVQPAEGSLSLESCSHSQLVLTQPPSASVSLGNTVRLSCAFSSGVSVSNYYVQWYQQKPGSPPRFLLWYYSDSSKGQGSGVPARFSGSKDTSASSGILTISGVLAEDEADYYCAAAHGSSGSSSSSSTWQLTQTRAPEKKTRRRS